jgi:hypothetical protein
MHKPNHAPSAHRAQVLGAALLISLWLPVVALAVADVRILIDVSGSMKLNDPNNLRVPAMRLVSELLPQGTRAGVWLFGEDATALIEPREVDDNWRSEARARLSRIHSRGLFTHIERASDAATAGWESEAAVGERHIVLLTDGMVDVSKDAKASAASRARILAGQLQRLRSYDAQVHAVTLSDNVDHELMEVLTSTTGGLLEGANDAERLQRIFLHMLEQTAAPITVPIEDKQFDIDASVSELTLLVFREGEEIVRQIAPDGVIRTASDAGPGIAWRSESGYELVTIANPKPGTWRFEGAEDPDNRAVVVTDMAMDMDPLRGTMLASEGADLNAWITDSGARIEQLDLIELVAVDVRIEGDGFEPTSGPMLLNRETSRFEGRLDGRALPAGEYRLTIAVDGGTFKREINRRVHFVADPVTVSYSEEAGETTTLVIDIAADTALVDGYSLSGYVAVTDPAGEARAYPLPKTASGQTQLRIVSAGPGMHEFAPSIYFTTRHGRSLHLEPAPQAFELAHSAPADEEIAAPPGPPLPESVSWLRAMGYVVVANLLLACGFAGIWWAFRAPKAAPLSPEAQPA